MALTAAVLRTLLLKNLHSDGTISDPTDLDTFMTLGQRRIVRDSPSTLGIKSGSISVVSPTRTYALASDFYQMRSVFYATLALHLEPIPVHQFVGEVESMTTIPSGAPNGYCIRGFSVADTAWTIAFDRIPDASYTYTYWYYWMPADLSSTTISPISYLGFDELLLWAATMIARERNDQEGAATAAGRYAEHLQEYRAFNAMGPDYAPVMGGYTFGRSGSTLGLPDHY